MEFKRNILFMMKFTEQMSTFFKNLRNTVKIEAQKQKKQYQNRKKTLQKLIHKCQKQGQKQMKKKVKKQKMKRMKANNVIPKAPPSPYFLFYMQHRQKIKNDFPEYGAIQINRLSSQLWKELTPDERQEYQRRFKIQKEIYKKDKQKFKQQQNMIEMQVRQQLEHSSSQQQDSKIGQQIHIPQKVNSANSQSRHESQVQLVISKKAEIVDQNLKEEYLQDNGIHYQNADSTGYSKQPAHLNQSFKSQDSI